MARTKVKEKPGRGRPKTQPKSGEELRLAALQRMQTTAERKGQIDHSASEEALQIMLDEKELKKQTKAELKELRRMAERLWDQLQIDKQYQQDLAWEGGYGVNRSQTSEEMQAIWDEEHKFLKPKRKNAKKVHNIYDLPEKKREAKGLVSEPVKMELDLDATEAELEKVMMEEAILQRQRELQYPKGRRVVSRPKVDIDASPKKSFWV